MLKKSKMLKKEIARAAEKMLREKLPEQELEGLFDGFSVKMSDPGGPEAEPNNFIDFGIDPKEFGSDQKTFFFVINELMGKRKGK